MLTSGQALFLNDCCKQSDLLTVLPEPVESNINTYREFSNKDTTKVKSLNQKTCFLRPWVSVLPEQLLDFHRKKCCVTKGLVPKGAVVSVYSGNSSFSTAKVPYISPKFNRIPSLVIRAKV